jgi:hypothetical protein
MTWKYWISGLLGLAIIAVPFLNLAENTSLWVLGITGGIIAVVSFLGLAESQNTESKSHSGAHA